MADSPHAVHDAVPMHLVLPDASVLPIRADLTFDPADPYTVRADFVGSHSTSTWLIGRELFAHGILADAASPAGTGDVRVWRDEDPTYLLISLSGVEGDALLAGPAEPFVQFISTSVKLVPFGQESSHMEDEISRLITSLLQA
ncbi:SsgA family sporulation/cell division regulator [Isoptericola sp. b441]|uniref:SsgA family sporulation/cell division regulator n=1 Tax=Actinotalea lenta TaxID=3064654 RepID=A0ABT9DAC1_9CELL|nr:MULTISPECIES: SsgA family sporulation/cell division regulator [unclassified Isoptericola]MDO8107835.1 SsgA family sporulation/cell division regulator [Isoptericola sp. b441]MDO8120494.1 SsgA family sporulation/cell division regulator [Isoptericola sp. b490]